MLYVKRLSVIDVKYTESIKRIYYIEIGDTMPKNGEREYKHERIAPKEDFDPRSFRTKEIKPGVKIIVGCPKGEFDAKKKLCKVGTKLQKIMRKK